ncbi:uncharacterized protein DEA37_0003001 [Paragonimus westermani]|uniref:Potassium channel domain-containing protein n=1 Tax=Paragonimus westermani TaxID=34504 RepID=A0A5J4P023_9TREM|nr:uncharacterized protein DEA37_0003001 [Paragonimus westermani]
MQAFGQLPPDVPMYAMRSYGRQMHPRPVSNMKALSILKCLTTEKIRYGHATPKTSHGKIGTIIYALVGIPLVFLYLSNIGDYLADVFRAIYTRTCRNACENYCSISLLASIVQTFLKRHRVRNSETQNEELPQLDATTSTPHGQFRRRKRVLLTTAWNTIENKHAEENLSEMEQTDNVNDITDTTVPKEHNTAQTTKVDRPPISDRIDSLFKKLGFARVARSQKIKEAINAEPEATGVQRDYFDQTSSTGATCTPVVETTHLVAVMFVINYLV